MKDRRLTHGERYAMANMLHQAYSLRAIGLVLGRAAFTISRERKRNATRHDGAYRTAKAQQCATTRRRRTRKKGRYSWDEWTQVDRLLAGRWSPQQIEGRRRASGERTMSKERIYRHVRRDRRASRRLWRHLQIMSKFGRKRRGSPAWLL